jgi:hypothetical protein
MKILADARKQAEADLGAYVCLTRFERAEFFH